MIKACRPGRWASSALWSSGWRRSHRPTDLAATLGFVVLAPDYGYTAFGPVGGVFVLY